MKITNLTLRTIFAMLLMYTISSCQKLTDINTNHNAASSTHPQALLPKVIWDAFHSGRGTAPLYALKMIVQTDGENANQIYNWQNGSFSPYGNMRNVTKMMEEAVKLNELSYVAIGKFFRAYYFYNLTLTFGDIPYSEALQGESEKIYEPKYDTQKEVLVGILAELTEAEKILKDKPDPFKGDIIYQGNAAQWIKLINAFRLKVLLTCLHKLGDTDLQIKAQFASIYQSETLFGSDRDDAKLVFINQDGNRYPEFNSSGYGSGMYMDSTFVQRLQERKDPRLFVIASQTRLGKEAGAALDDFSAYEGGDPTVPYAKVNDKAVRGKLSKVHSRYTLDPVCEPLVLLGYAEQQFIVAEAQLRGWIVGDANVSYESGIHAAFNFYREFATGLSSFVTEDKVTKYLQEPMIALSQTSTVEGKIERVLMQKYLRSFHQGGYTAYFDHLRTGYPSLMKADKVKVAYRWMYPQSEYNQNTVQVAEAIKRQYAGNDNIHSKPWWLQ